ncbi:MAG: riboflavin synthase [Lentisphaeraceae bacterium]|nr:riboflavin synthase [Lentisphaeraceae bacterium]
MYSGIITREGIVVANEGDQNGYKLTVASDVCSLVKTGDSVGINGVCLTVTEFDDQKVSFDVWPETLKRTTLPTIVSGDKVHVDLPLKHGEYNGGHNILGHVDFIADLVELTSVEGSDQVKIWFSLPKNFRDLMPIRGCVSVDGVSLTITDRNSEAFSVSLIPETLNRTHLGKITKGDKVNIEVDFNSRHIQDESGVLSLNIPDEVRAEKVDSQEEWALASLKKGSAALIVDESPERTEVAIVVATEKLTEEVLTFAMGMARSGCLLAVENHVAERLAIPAPVVNSQLDEEGRRYLVQVRDREVEENDFSAKALLKSIEMFHNVEYSVGDWICPGNVAAVQILSSEIDRPRNVLEGAIGLTDKASLYPSALCITMLAANGERLSKDQAEAFATRFELPIVSLKQALS